MIPGFIRADNRRDDEYWNVPGLMRRYGPLVNDTQGYQWEVDPAAVGTSHDKQKRICDTVKRLISDWRVRDVLNIAYRRSSDLKREVAGVVTVDDAKGGQYGLAGQLVIGSFAQVAGSAAATTWIRHNTPYDVTHNIYFVFYFHTHPHAKGTSNPDDPREVTGDPNVASRGDLAAFRYFNQQFKEWNADFAIVISATHFVAYNDNNPSLCSFAR